jgi:disulfide bond formation protein DsbB
MALSDTAPDSAPVRAAALAFAIGLATILGAWGFQLIGGYVPCKLCLTERIPYYAGLPLLLVAMVAASRTPRLSRGLSLLAAIVFLVGAGIGVYHAGAEWGWWLGPSDCGGGVAVTTSAADLLKQIQSTKVVSCTEASWRLFGLSFAGWNAVVSFAVALLALRAATAPRSASI